jgi:photosystem II stability/assembly factor-like uncharacterized protein
MRRVSVIAGAVLFSAASFGLFGVGGAMSGCSDESDGSNEEKRRQGKKTDTAGRGEGKGAAKAKGAAGRGKDGGGRRRAGGLGAGGGGAGQGGGLARGFLRWRPVRAFLSAGVEQVVALGRGSAIALLKDGHVGVTSDGGKSWHFQRLLYGNPKAIDGKPGGPYFAVGDDGYAARSSDGKQWQTLPVVTDEDLDDVVFARGAAMAIGRSTVVTFGEDGKSWSVFELPRDKRPKEIVRHGNNPFLVMGTREVWSSPDGGKTWVAMETPPKLPGTREAMTSQGVCSLGRVGRTTGMVCTVEGTAYGLAEGEVAVVSRDAVQVTQDAGKSWKVARPPFSGINWIGGYAGGPYFAVGKAGGLARSQEGSSWVEPPLDTNATLRDVAVVGDTVVGVGSQGTVVVSKDRGKTFRVIVVEPKRNFTHIVAKEGGKTLVLPVGGEAMVSADGGVTWNEPADVEALGDLSEKPSTGRCESAIPSPGATCKLSRVVTSQKDLPRMRTFDFAGDLGVAGGDDGLLAVTTDGGASWESSHGLDLRGGIKDLQVSGDLVVGVGKSSLVFSKDGGESWQRVEMEPEAGALTTAFVDSEKTVYLAGARATVMRSVDDTYRNWLPLKTGAPAHTRFIKVTKSGGAVYAAGERGSLYRSEDGGSSWARVPTDLSRPVVGIVSKDETVFAVTAARYGWKRFKGENVLLRSDDGGKHFRVVASVSPGGPNPRFRLDDEGALHYQNLVSHDGGRTWNRHRKRFRPGAVAVSDGTGRYIGNWGYRRYGRGRFAFYVFDSDFDDWAIVEPIYNEDAFLRCDAGTGCWMACGSSLYRPF